MINARLLIFLVDARAPLSEKMLPTVEELHSKQTSLCFA